jgi:hypothetical protein
VVAGIVEEPSVGEGGKKDWERGSWAGGTDTKKPKSESEDAGVATSVDLRLWDGRNRMEEVGFGWVNNIGGRLGEAGGVCGLKRVANLSKSESESGSGMSGGIDMVRASIWPRDRLVVN